MAKLLVNESQDDMWNFHIFGEGALEITLKKQALKNAIENGVTFHGHRNDLSSCLKAMDCLIMCSDHEGLPMTRLESIALGTPVIAHKTGGLIDIINNSSGGKLVSDHTPDGYKEALSCIFEHEQKFERMKVNGSRNIKLYYRTQKNSETTSSMYRNLTNS